MPDQLRDVTVPFTQAELASAKIKPDVKRAEQLMREAARREDGAAIQWCKNNGVRR
jgi:hypothetical protein